MKHFLVTSIVLILLSFEAAQARHVKHKSALPGTGVEMLLVSAMLLAKANASVNVWGIDSSIPLNLPLNQEELIDAGVKNTIQYLFPALPLSDRPQWNYNYIQFPSLFLDKQSQLAVELFHQITDDLKVYLGGTVLTLEQLLQKPEQTSLVLEDNRGYLVGLLRIVWRNSDVHRAAGKALRIKSNKIKIKLHNAQP